MQSTAQTVELADYPFTTITLSDNKNYANFNGILIPLTKDAYGLVATDRIHPIYHAINIGAAYANARARVNIVTTEYTILISNNITKLQYTAKHAGDFIIATSLVASYVQMKYMEKIIYLGNTKNVYHDNILHQTYADGQLIYDLVIVNDTEHVVNYLENGKNIRKYFVGDQLVSTTVDNVQTYKAVYDNVTNINVITTTDLVDNKVTVNTYNQDVLIKRVINGTQTFPEPVKYQMTISTIPMERKTLTVIKYYIGNILRAKATFGNSIIDVKVFEQYNYKGANRNRAIRSYRCPAIGRNSSTTYTYTENSRTDHTVWGELLTY